MAIAKDYGDSDWDDKPVDDSLLTICRNSAARQVVLGEDILTSRLLAVGWFGTRKTEALTLQIVSLRGQTSIWRFA